MTKKRIHEVLRNVKLISIMDRDHPSPSLFHIDNEQKATLLLGKINRLIDSCNNRIKEYDKIIRKMGENPTGAETQKKREKTEKIYTLLEQSKTSTNTQDQKEAEYKRLEEEFYKIEKEE